MASRSNKSARTYGAPSYTPPSTAAAQGRPQVGAGTSEQRRAAMAADAAAARAGARQAAEKRKQRQAQQQPASQETTDLSALNAARTIKKKQAKDKRVIEEMSR